MCGACGANAPTSTVTAFLGLRGLEPAFTRTVAQRLGTRASLGRFGAHWSLRDRTGGTRLLRTAEEL
ncbi:hypothetical protein OOT08_10320, partial [Leucobacter sp. M11]|nr:hypothetical protein [Leucobacter sp. M11]